MSHQQSDAAKETAVVRVLCPGVGVMGFNVGCGPAKHFYLPVKGRNTFISLLPIGKSHRNQKGNTGTQGAFQTETPRDLPEVKPEKWGLTCQ